MEAKERRQHIISLLKSTGKPLTGTVLAKELGVSRQVIVGDVAILRASGAEIYATPQGYVILPVTASGTVTARFACSHSVDRMEEELAIIVDNGGRVLDVSVEHPVYGEIKASLILASRYDLAEFLHKSAKSGAIPLSVVTGGVHLHTVEAPTTDILHKIAAELRALRILLE